MIGYVKSIQGLIKDDFCFKSLVQQDHELARDLLLSMRDGDSPDSTMIAAPVKPTG